MPNVQTISNREVLFLAFASAIVTANAYYIHPIIRYVADSFGVSGGLVGVIPALNQVALAMGVLLLLPLGDRVNNGRLVAVCLTASVLALITMALAQSFVLFATASTVLGFFTITPYLLPAYVSKRVETKRLGHVTAMLTSGVIAGVQLSRVASGAIGEYLDWRAVYLIAAGLMAIAAIILPRTMQDQLEREPKQGPGYLALLGSLIGLARSNHRVIISGVIQGLNFGVFIATWLGISLHLTSPEMGYGSDLVGYLTLITMVSLLSTTYLGRLADKRGPERSRVFVALIQLFGISLYAVTGGVWWHLLIPILLTSLVGPMVDVTGRMTSLNKPSEIRTRLMSLYVAIMFIGGGLGSFAGTLAYDAGGWSGSVTLMISLTVIVSLLSIWQYRTSEERRAE